MSAEAKKINERVLGELLEEAGVGLSGSRLGQLWRFHLFLRQQNPRLNLTRIFNFHSMVRKHYVDSLLVAPLLEKHGLEWPAVTMDLGTGPGFPGIPLAIALPDRRFILAEGRGQRVKFLEEAVKVTGLNNAEVFGGRIHAGRGAEVDAVVTRAVELIPPTIERMLPYVRSGGLFLFMKGPNCDEEIAVARERYGDWIDLAFDEAYTLPDSRDRRRLVVWRRNAEVAPLTPAASGATFPARMTAEQGEAIFSRDNEKFKAAKLLQSSRGIKKQKRALVSGLRVVNEYLTAHPDLCRAVLLPEKAGDALPDSPETRAFLEGVEETELAVQFFQRELFQELDLIGTGPPLLLIEAAVMGDFEAGSPLPDGGTLFLPMGDPENLGAALRSAAAFDVSHCVLLSEAAHPYHPRALRSAAGATPRLSLLKGPRLQDLPGQVNDLFVLDPEGDDIRDVEFPERFGLLAGPEGGFERKSHESRPDAGNPRGVRIPTSGRVESLNTTVALSIALYILREREVL